MTSYVALTSSFYNVNVSAFWCEEEYTDCFTHPTSRHEDVLSIHRAVVVEICDVLRLRCSLSSSLSTLNNYSSLRGI
jgi:hypothetical protein